jgi:hypothetical protein
VLNIWAYTATALILPVQRADQTAGGRNADQVVLEPTDRPAIRQSIDFGRVHPGIDNARDVGLQHGRFDFDGFIDHLITFIEVLGQGTHVVAVCRPCVAVLAAAAVMAEYFSSGAAVQHDVDGGSDRVRLG